MAALSVLTLTVIVTVISQGTVTSSQTSSTTLSSASFSSSLSIQLPSTHTSVVFYAIKSAGTSSKYELSYSRVVASILTIM